MTCAHHWTIASPNGPTSAGVCRLCGAERQFRNVSPDNDISSRADAKALMSKRTHAERNKLAGVTPRGGTGL